MPETIEISSLDLRYEKCRLKAPGAEKILLGSILENGIRDPLQGVDAGEQHILLDGFKRYRCAVKLGIGIVPYVSLATDEACGLIALLRTSNAKSLSILEQARFIDELKSVHQMTTAEIAGLLEKSKAWVSVRSGIIGQMSKCVAQHIFAGRFPVYCFMYTLRSFMRLNAAKTDDIDSFVQSVAGKNLSIRDIDLLAHGYFKGSEDFRKQIRAGNTRWVLERLKKPVAVNTKCTKAEQGIIRMLEVCLRYMQRLTVRCRTCRFKTDDFLVEANLLSGGIIRQIDSFTKAMGDFYDHTRQTPGHLPAASGGHGASPDCPSPECEHQHGALNY
jgi:hypothetical protein